GEQDDVTLAVRDVYDGRLFRDFVRASNHAAEEKILFGGKAKNHARLLIRRGNCPAGKFRQIFGDKELLFVRRAFDGLFRRHVGASLNHIGIGERASAARARSEERRVGKECRSWGGGSDQRKRKRRRIGD